MLTVTRRVFNDMVHVGLNTKTNTTKRTGSSSSSIVPWIIKPTARGALTEPYPRPNFQGLKKLVLAGYPHLNVRRKVVDNIQRFHNISNAEDIRFYCPIREQLHGIN